MPDYSPSFYSLRQSSVVVDNLTELTSVPDNKSICIGYRILQKITEKVLPYLSLYLHTISIANTCINT